MKYWVGSCIVVPFPCQRKVTRGLLHTTWGFTREFLWKLQFSHFFYIAILGAFFKLHCLPLPCLSDALMEGKEEGKSRKMGTLVGADGYLLCIMCRHHTHFSPLSEMVGLNFWILNYVSITVESITPFNKTHSERRCALF